ncbi:hypothetical protein BJ165DRAFT_1522741 [Panaeolus papilionaceus]|nr:hypothetical protein BJ165DRAFT_1522741 [Panaeolus papilionaceus]
MKRRFFSAQQSVMQPLAVGLVIDVALRDAAHWIHRVFYQEGTVFKVVTSMSKTDRPQGVVQTHGRNVQGVLPAVLRLTHAVGPPVVDPGIFASEAIVSTTDRIAKFELDIKENLELLKNMCEGMKRGNGGIPRNTEVLTYRGKAKKFPRGKVRKAAGCVSKYCRKLIDTGASASLNSCDEYPPAMSLEGGDFRDASERIIACIPDVQNSRQGNRFSNLVQAFEKINGRELQQGDKFVVSVECDKVASLGGAELPEPVIRRQTIEPMQGQAGVDSEIKGFEIPDSFVLIPLGDLDPGSYTIEVQGVEGSTTAGFVYDRDGDEMFTTIATGVSGGQSQQMTFQFPDPMFGISVALNTLNNNTKVTWSLRGDPTLTQTPSPSTSAGGGPNGSPRSFASSIHWKREIQLAVISCIVFLILV